jgi:hypothetical protein
MVIARMIGVPESDFDRFKIWSNQATRGLEPFLSRKQEKELHRANDELDDYFHAIIEERRRDPGDDLLSGLILAEEEGDKLTVEEMTALLRSIDRPGDYCTQGRLFVPMPLVDPSVRACRQIDAARLRVAGGAWRDTLEQIVVRAATGLGCPPERTCAHLYKLLIYERGGFFAAHRDTEKEDGMVATLVLSLPVAGAGGELTIRHQQRETVVDLRARPTTRYALGYSLPVGRTARIAFGLEHESESRDSGVSAYLRKDF